MANFFKEYHAELKEKRTAAESTKKDVEYERGQTVFIDPMYDENRNGKRYFVDYLGSGGVLLAKTKKDAMNGYGYIYSICTIVK
jgi:hypothetical protein